MNSKVALFCLLATSLASNQVSAKEGQMKLNAGIITEKLSESKLFYTQKLGFSVVFENDWYVLLSTSGKSPTEIAFMKPDLKSQAEIFRKRFTGQGVWITIEVDDVDSLYKKLKETVGIPIAVQLKDEEWGDRHFAVLDPNGIGIDFVRFRNPN